MIDFCSGGIVNFLVDNKTQDKVVIKRDVSSEPEHAFYNGGKAVKALEPNWQDYVHKQ